MLTSIAGARARPAERVPTLLARAGTVWLWPGVPLTRRRGETIVPIEADAARFWITPLHGPEAFQTPILQRLDRAAVLLSAGKEAAAQRVLDGTGLDRLSPEGAALAKAIAVRLGVSAPAVECYRRAPLWQARDLAAQLPLFDRYAETADWLDKAGSWDESKHPRWPEGAPQSQGGRFRPAGQEDGAAAGPNGAASGRPQNKTDASSAPPRPDRPGIGHNGGPPLYDDAPEVPPEDPGPSTRWQVIKKIARWLAPRVLPMAGEDIEGGPIGLLLNGAQIAAWA